MGGIRGRLRCLEREAREGAVLIHQRDGGVRAFDAMDVHAEMFLAQVDLYKGEARSSGVLDAVRNATPESRAAFEEQFGEIAMEARIVAGSSEGAWVEVYTLLEDGTVERAYHEGGSEEAERIRQEAQQGSGGGRWGA